MKPKRRKAKASEDKMTEKRTGFRRISNEAVLAKTGKGWEEWFRILDEWGMKEKGHTATAKHLREGYGLRRW